jgi:uncharacterized protein YodC (DUF2158 family)
MPRRFRPGDRVQRRSGGPVMEVMKYVLKNKPILGAYQSESEVECVWYDVEEGRHLEICHQDTLIKLPYTVPPIKTGK